MATSLPHFRSYCRGELELFDCDSDPLEVKNLAGDPRHEEVVRRLQGLAEGIRAKLGDAGRAGSEIRPVGR